MSEAEEVRCFKGSVEEGGGYYTTRPRPLCRGEMTKTEYRKYLSSPHWQARRKSFLELVNYCERCDLPRWLAVIAYDQDLHVHHESYANLGNESEDDLLALCRRCHELETFGSSSLHALQKVKCDFCVEETFDVVDRLCRFHRGVLEATAYGTPIPRILKNQLLEAASNRGAK